jgi:predicted DCC family thiol-disulfide oxidoreductase YuxK
MTSAQSPLTDAGLDGLMVFDGVCRLCSGWVRFVCAVDRRSVIRFASVQSKLGRTLCEREGIDPDDPSTFLFFDRGSALQASDAVIAMVSRLQPPWRWLEIFKLVPPSLRNAIYFWIARHRYRLFGRKRACFVPTQEMLARFVDDERSST